MADQYTMNWSNGTSFAVQPRTQNTTASSITIYGKGMRNYGEGIQENILHILENFANATPPANAVMGQLWYNTVAGVLNVYNGAWVAAGTDPTFVAAVNAHIANTTSHLTIAEKAMLTSLQTAVPNPADLVYLSGLTGNVQIQLNANTSDVANKVNKSGDSMTGALSMSNNFIHNLVTPTSALDATNKSYVDAAIFTAIQALSTSAPGESLYQKHYEVYATNGQTGFILPWTHVIGSGDLAVFINGVRQAPTAYTEVNSTTVTMSVGLTGGDEVIFCKFIFGGGLNGTSLNGIASVNGTTQTAPGGTSAFVVPTYNPGRNDLLVWVNGVKQISGVGQSYIETNSTTITFSQNLTAGDVVMVGVLILMNPSTGPGQPWPSYSEIYREVITASTAGQTTFTLTTPYHHTTTTGDKDNAGICVFIQGVFQGTNEFTETNGTGFVLAGGVPVGTVLEFYAYKFS